MVSDVGEGFHEFTRHFSSFFFWKLLIYFYVHLTIIILQFRALCTHIPYAYASENLHESGLYNCPVIWCNIYVGILNDMLGFFSIDLFVM